jgi:photosystem II stability/assembly factor-like uncharacterized protein
MKRSGIALPVVAAGSSLLALAVSIVLGIGANSAFATGRPLGGAIQANYGMAIDGRDGLVVVNRSGVLRTVDGGASWANITPRSLRRLVDHIAKVIAIGPHIWLEMEGDERFGFLPYSRDGGRSWQIARIAGSVQMPNLVFENPRDGWVTATAPNFKKVQYRTVDGGRTWHRSGHRPKVTVPSTVSGVRASAHGAVPAGLKITDAVRSPGGPSWAQASGPTIGSYFPTYLLRSTDGGRAWTIVPNS